MKKKYIETLKDIRVQLHETTQNSLLRMESEWKNRALRIDSEWKERMREACGVCKRRFGCHECFDELVKRLDL